MRVQVMSGGDGSGGGATMRNSVRLAALPMLLLAVPAVAATNCGVGPIVAATANSLTLQTLPWTPFRKLETGWETYAPLIAAEIGTTCSPAAPGFAQALAVWQRARGLPATGVFDARAFVTMFARWQARRPFVALRGRGVCPNPPRVVLAARGYLGKTVKLRPKALGAYRAMVAAAHADVSALRRDARWLAIYSGFRDPAADAARCVTEGNCDGSRRAVCSAHRTGLALDLYVGEAPGYGPDSTKDPNRRAMSATPAYRWLVANAKRFGFVNYAYEPWHWEWTGEAP